MAVIRDKLSAQFTEPVSRSPRITLRDDHYFEVNANARIEGMRRYSSYPPATQHYKDTGEKTASRPDRFTHANDPVPIVQESLWISELFWTDR